MRLFAKYFFHCRFLETGDVVLKKFGLMHACNSASSAVGAGGGCLDILLSSILSLLFLPLFGRRPNID